MRRSIIILVAVVALGGIVVYMAAASERGDGEAAPIYGVRIPAGYRDWKLIAVNHLLRAGKADQLRSTRQRHCDQGH